MCANFLSGNVSELVGYTYPKLHKGKDWYVDFYARDQSRHSDITTTNKYIQKHGVQQVTLGFEGNLTYGDDEE